MVGGVFLGDLIRIFSVAVIVLFICHRFRVPGIVGFLLTGVIAGPHGLGLVTSVEQVEVLAELGVIVLMFSIGLEFSFRELIDIRRTVLIGGTVQVALSILMTVVIATAFKIEIRSAVFLGFLVALSSTAIVLKQLGERGELAAPQGKVDLGILIYQDLIVVPMIMFTPFLGAGGFPEPVGLVLAKTVGVIILVILLANYIIPPLLYQVTRTGSRELFLLCIVVICFGVAWMTNQAGLSLALGAFLAGLIIAESEYSHQALGNIVPFLDTFTSLFFVSIGMLLNLSIVSQHIQTVLFLTILLIVGKALLASLATIVLGYPLRTAILVGFSICQVGEFSFILSQSGLQYQLINPALYQGFLSSAIITMMLTPFLMNLAPRFADYFLNLPFSERIKSGKWKNQDSQDNSAPGHLSIIGYGVNGRNLARAATAANIRFKVVEINAETVRKEKKKGVPIIYGDATQETVLTATGLDSAKILVIAIHDATATRRIISLARRMNPTLHILVRTRFVADIEDLYRLGANEVIPEEYETSVEIFSRVLTRYLVPRDEIEELVEKIRKQDYDMFRSLHQPSTNFLMFKNMHLNDVEVGTVRVNERAGFAGASIHELDLRNRYEVSVLAIQRGEETISNPGGRAVIEDGDVLFVLGSQPKINEFARRVR
ncbi:MAG: cation:proton antiporter [Bacillota bacterium]|nr:cation:proton antiporter [Bacillota bacterium]